MKSPVCFMLQAIELVGMPTTWEPLVTLSRIFAFETSPSIFGTGLQVLQ